MHINDDKKAVFYHVMKTGGSSLHHMLERPTELLQRQDLAHERWIIIMGMHGSYSQLLKEHPEAYEKIKDYYKFMFVRNPWSHAVSSYFHTTSPERFDKENHMGNNKRRATKDDYKDFNYYLQHLYRPQSESTIDDPKFMNDESYYFEDYDNEVRRLFKRFGYSEKAFDSKIKHHNKSSVNIFGNEYPSNYRVMYNQTGVDIIADRCKSYIDTYNYQY